jgi:hypothetical protein
MALATKCCWFVQSSASWAGLRHPDLATEASPPVPVSSHVPSGLNQLDGRCSSDQSELIVQTQWLNIGEVCLSYGKKLQLLLEGLTIDSWLEMV